MFKRLAARIFAHPLTVIWNAHKICANRMQIRIMKCSISIHTKYGTDYFELVVCRMHWAAYMISGSMCISFAKCGFQPSSIGKRTKVEKKQKLSIFRIRICGLQFNVFRVKMFAMLKQTVKCAQCTQYTHTHTPKIVPKKLTMFRNILGLKPNRPWNIVTDATPWTHIEFRKLCSRLQGAQWTSSTKVILGKLSNAFFTLCIQIKCRVLARDGGGQFYFLFFT